MSSRSQRIRFEEIQAGDRIRVRYNESDQRGYYNNSAIDVKTHCITSVASLLCLDKVWLTEDGYTLAHRNWHQMEIYKLEEAPK